MGDGFADVRVQVHGIDEVHVGVFLREVLHRGDHGDEAVAEVFAAVAGDEDELLAVGEAGDIVTRSAEYILLGSRQFRVDLELVHDLMQRVDHRIARHENLPGGLLFQKVTLRQGRGREVVGRNAARHLPVHFLRPGAVEVARAQARLHMADGNLLIESCDSGGGRCCRVAMDQNHIRLDFLQDIAHAGKHPCGHVVEILALLHDVQVVIRHDLEDAQHLVQHLAVLARHAHNRLELSRILLELLYQRAHLDGLRPRAENEHYSLHRNQFSAQKLAKTL